MAMPERVPWNPKPKPNWNLLQHRIGQLCQHRHSGIRRCDEGFCSLGLRKLPHCRLPKQTLGLAECSFHLGISLGVEAYASPWPNPRGEVAYDISIPALMRMLAHPGR